MSPNLIQRKSSEQFQRISLSYNNADSQASALRLVLSLLPEWEHSEGRIEFIRFTDGITNTLLKAVKRRPGYTEEQIDNEAILLRAYGKGTEVLIDRQRETMSHSLLAQHKLAPLLLARFENGLLYKFIRGRVCHSIDLSDEAVYKGVARRLGEWHAILPVVFEDDAQNATNGDQNTLLSSSTSKSIPCTKQINKFTPNRFAPNLWTVMQKWIFALQTGTEAERKRKDTLQHELDRTVKELVDTPGVGKDSLVFAHCDLLCGNVIIQPPSPTSKASLAPPVETVSFIDYEYATPSPASFDIANHFAEWGGLECDYAVLPTRSQRRTFLREYLASYQYYTISSQNFSNASLRLSSKGGFDDEVERLFMEVDAFRGIPGLYWGIWALIQATISQIDFDYAAYAEVRLGEYWAWRAEQSGERVREGAEMPPRERRWAEES